MPTAVSRRSSVVTATGLLSWPPRIFLYALSRPALRPPTSIQQVPWAQSLEFTRPGRKADHLLPSKWSNVAKEWVELYLHSSSCRRCLHNGRFTFTVLRPWPTRPSGPSWNSYLSFQNPVVTYICITGVHRFYRCVGATYTWFSVKCRLHVTLSKVVSTKRWTEYKIKCRKWFHCWGCIKF